jgi:hypothetical protein
MDQLIEQIRFDMQVIADQLRHCMVEWDVAYALFKLGYCDQVSSGDITFIRVESGRVYVIDDVMIEAGVEEGDYEYARSMNALWIAT